MGLTVDVGKQMIAWGADYVVNYAQDFAPQLNTWEGELQEKNGARLVVNPAVVTHAGAAQPASQPIAHAA